MLQILPSEANKSLNTFDSVICHAERVLAGLCKSIAIRVKFCSSDGCVMQCTKSEQLITTAELQPRHLLRSPSKWRYRHAHVARRFENMCQPSQTGAMIWCRHGAAFCVMLIVCTSVRAREFQCENFSPTPQGKQ